jgi:hypothetical protein
MIDPLTIDIAAIAELGTRVATAGALRVMEFSDDIFEYIIGIAIVIHEQG